MTALRDLLRAYGGVVGGYVLAASALWLVLMILLPQLTILDHSFWFEDRKERAAAEREVEALYVEIQLRELALRRLARDIEAAGDSAEAERLRTEHDEARQEVAALRAQAAALEAEADSALRSLKRQYGLRNYRNFLENEGHLRIFLKTIWASSVVTLVCFAVCYPVTYYIVHVAPRRRTAVIMLGLLVPYWVNEILRTFAWLMILSYSGLFNTLLTGLGIVDRPVNFLAGNGGVLVGMVYAYILLMVFPMYNSMETLDRHQIEAARDLGAPWWAIHWEIVLPHAKPGIAMGCIMTFMLAAGSYAVPVILGGPSGDLWFTQIIYNQFMTTRDWNSGSAYAVMLLLLCVLFIFLVMRLARVKLQDMAR